MTGLNRPVSAERDCAADAGVILLTERLTREVDGQRLVDAVSISVRRGEVVAIIGPSGSGKTSLLRLLNRLDEPTGGSILIEGRDYREIPPAELRRRVGMLLQQPFLFPGTVAENLSFGPEAHGEALAPERAAELLERVGLPDYAGRDVARLSGGEAQRVSLARTLANDPEILLLDEPTSALDTAAQLGVEELICNVMTQQGLTCVVVTHDHAQAVRMARRAVIMEAGRVVEDGPVTEIVHAR